jgi:hypothetical protein
MALHISLVDSETKRAITYGKYKDHLGQDIRLELDDDRDMYRLRLRVFWRNKPLVTMTGTLVVKLIKIIVTSVNLSHLKAIHKYIDDEMADREKREKNTQRAREIGALND